MYTFGQKWPIWSTKLHLAPGRVTHSQVSVAGAIDVEWGGYDYDVTPTWNNA
jgi:hypothetical protein